MLFRTLTMSLVLLVVHCGGAKVSPKSPIEKLGAVEVYNPISHANKYYKTNSGLYPQLYSMKQVDGSLRYGFAHYDRWLVAPDLVYAEPYAHDRALLAKANQTGTIEYGFVDPKGKIAIPRRFAWATSFYEGEALVRFPDGAIAVIDTTGKPGLLNGPGGALPSLAEVALIEGTFIGRDEKGWGFLKVTPERASFANQERWDEIAYAPNYHWRKSGDEYELEIRGTREHTFPLRGRRGKKWYIVDSFTLEQLQGLGNERGFEWIGHDMGAGYDAGCVLVKYADRSERIFVRRNPGLYRVPKPGPHLLYGLEVMDIVDGFRICEENKQFAGDSYSDYLKRERGDMHSAALSFELASWVGGRKRVAYAEAKYQEKLKKQRVAEALIAAQQYNAPSGGSSYSAPSYAPSTYKPPAFDQSAANRSFNDYKNYLNGNTTYSSGYNPRPPN